MRLKRNLSLLCKLYNELRDEKIRRYKENGESLTQTDLRAMALGKRRNNNDNLQTVFSQAVQNTADRVHSAFKNYLGGRARFPKNKKYSKYRSLTYPQFGFQLNNQTSRLYLAKIGSLRIFLHRAMRGEIRRLSIKYEAGEWYAIFITKTDGPERPPIEIVPDEKISGIDLGIEKFAVLDNGASIRYPEFLRQSEEKIKRLQRRLPRRQRGSKRWKQICFSLAKLHLHVKRQRDDFQNKEMAELYKKNDVLVLEGLNVRNMLRNHNLAKSIADASFCKFIRKALFKAEMLGKHFIAVDPWGTTQFCYSCLEWVPKDLSERQHHCPHCGEKLQRDLNSAKLVKRLGILSIRRRSPPSDGGSSLAEPKPLPSLRGMVSQGDEAGSHRF